MHLLKEVRFFLAKELILEWRQKYAIGGILLYVVATVYVIYSSLGQQNALLDLKKVTWNTLFWITLLFAAVNAVAKSFTQESRERTLYYYTIISPSAIIFSKIIYNVLLLLLLVAIAFGVFALMISNPVENPLMFVIAMGLGGIGFSLTLTMVSAIAAKASNNSTLMAILSFPIIIPMILLLQRLARFAYVEGGTLEQASSNIFQLLMLNMILAALSYLLFPYLWRD